MEILKMIFTEKASDYKVVDIVLKVWIAGLLTMFVVGMGTLLFHIISDPSVIDNATFGIFDTLG
jgi:hypothetical protein